MKSSSTVTPNLPQQLPLLPQAGPPPSRQAPPALSSGRRRQQSGLVMMAGKRSEAIRNKSGYTSPYAQACSPRKPNRHTVLASVRDARGTASDSNLIPKPRNPQDPLPPKTELDRNGVRRTMQKSASHKIVTPPNEVLEASNDGPQSRERGDSNDSATQTTPTISALAMPDSRPPSSTLTQETRREPDVMTLVETVTNMRNGLIPTQTERELAKLVLARVHEMGDLSDGDRKWLLEEAKLDHMFM